MTRNKNILTFDFKICSTFLKIKGQPVFAGCLFRLFERRIINYEDIKLSVRAHYGMIKTT